MSATGRIHVAVNMIPYPESPKALHEHLSLGREKNNNPHSSYPIIVPQLHEMKVPIYPTHGTSVLSRVIAGRMAGGIASIGMLEKNHVM
jgi:hypothetical protein